MPTFRRAKLVTAVIAAAAIAVTTVVVVSPRVKDPGGGPAPTDYELGRAREALDQWDKAFGDSVYIPIAPKPGNGSNPLAWQFQQVGDWPGGTGKQTPDSVALSLRVIGTTAPLPTTKPPPGQVVWADGGSTLVKLESQSTILGDLVNGADECVGCIALDEIDGVKARTLAISKVVLTTMQVQTTRGPATVPAYRFSFAGKSVQVLQAAVAGPPAWSLPANSGPGNKSIDSATISADRQTLTVQFRGAADPSRQPCGADYSAFAVESARAVAVIVTTKRHAGNERCKPTPGSQREAVVQLKAPLGMRAVLETGFGRAVRVRRG